MKRVVILGSTGSIGKNSLDVIKKYKSEFNVTALTTNKNIQLLNKQIKDFNPEAVCICDEKIGYQFKSEIPKEIKLFIGETGLLELISYLDFDIILFGISGIASLQPLIAAIKKNVRIALASKEPLVVAGDIIKERIKNSKSELIPVDSEHSAIFQCMDGKNPNEIKSLTLTASGGPLFRKKYKKITKEIVLKHPRWNMGKRITVDSATLLNKGFEMFEAHHLFNIPFKKINILIHPQSIVHSLVEFIDNSFFALLSVPDMRLPIQFALTYPKRYPSLVKKLDFEEIQKLEFFKPDLKHYPCLELAIEASKLLGTMPAVLNAADEVVVDAFLKEKIEFNQIHRIIRKVMNMHKVVKAPSLEEIISADTWAREQTKCLLRL